MKERLSGLFKRFYRLVFGSVLAPFPLFVLVACNGGGGNGGSSNNGGNGDGDERQYKLVFRKYVEVAGISASRGIALSPDQGDVYLTGQRNHHLVRLDRDATGDLTFKTLWKDGNGDGHGNTVNGLEGAFDVVVSPNDRHVYATGINDNALVRFSRDATGDLTFAQALIDGEGGVDGLDGATKLAVSADGGQVYVAGLRDDALTVFARDTTTGALTRSAIFKDGTDDVDGLDGAFQVVISPEGANVYVTAEVDDSVAVFNRNTATGALTFNTVLKDGSDDADGNAIDGLDSASGLAVSRDGKNVYVAGRRDDALAVF